MYSLYPNTHAVQQPSRNLPQTLLSPTRHHYRRLCISTQRAAAAVYGIKTGFGHADGGSALEPSLYLVVDLEEGALVDWEGGY